MAYCLVIDGKPVFYTSDLERVKGYAGVLLNNIDTKRKGGIDIIGGYDPNNPKPLSTYPVLYRKCNRCLKMYTFPYFLGEKEKAGNCCLHCREKRKAQYRKTYQGYNPVFVDEYIAKTYGREFVVNANWKHYEVDARPTSDLVKDYKPAFKNIYEEAKSFAKSTPIKKRLGRPRKEPEVREKVCADIRCLKPSNTVQEPIKQAEAVSEKPSKKRWSYRFVSGIEKPFVQSIDWYFDIDDKIRVVQHGNHLWKDYTLICYGETQKEVDKRINNFLDEHSVEIQQASLIKADFGWE